MVAVDASTPPPMTHKRASIDTHNFELAIEHGNVLKRRYLLNETLCVAKSLLLSLQVNVHINLEQFTKWFYQCTEIAMNYRFFLPQHAICAMNFWTWSHCEYFRIEMNTRNEFKKTCFDSDSLDYSFNSHRWGVGFFPNRIIKCCASIKYKINLLQTKYRYKTSSWAHNLFQIILANGLWIFLCLHSREHVNRQCDRPKYLFIQIHEIKLIFFCLVCFVITWNYFGWIA